MFQDGVLGFFVAKSFYSYLKNYLFNLIYVLYLPSKTNLPF